MTQDFWLSMVPLDDITELGSKVALALQAENDLGVGPMIVRARLRGAVA